MSIAKLIANEESNNEFVKDNSDTLKSILGIAGVGALVARGMSRGSTQAINKVKDGKYKTKLGEAGARLKTSVDDAFSKRTAQNIVNSKTFFDDLIEQASSVLKASIPGALENTKEASAEIEVMRKAVINEKTYLLTAVRDAVRDLNLAGELGDSSLLINKIEEVLESQMNKSGELSEDIISALQSIRNNVSDEKRVEQFTKFKAMKENSRYFSGRQKATGVAENLVKNNPVFSTFSEAFRGATAIAAGRDPFDADFKIPESRMKLQEKLQEDLDRFNKRLNQYGGNVRGFTVIKEHDQEVASIMMRIGSGDKELTQQIPLYASNIGNMRKIMRNTSTLTTPNAMPAFIVPVEDLQKIATQDVSRGEIFNILKRSTPERFSQNMLINYLESTGSMLGDLGERDMNKLTSITRMLGITVNRASLRANSPMNPLGTELKSNLAFQQAMYSTQIVGYTTGRETDKQLNELSINLLQKAPDIFDAPQASSTPIRKAEVKGMGVFRGVNVRLRKLDDQVLPTSLDVIRGFGFKDRGTSPLTAREQQFFGREELLVAVQSPGDRNRSNVGGGPGMRHEFGKGDLGSRIPIIASNDALLSVDQNINNVLSRGYAAKGSLGKVSGANLAGIMIFGNEQSFRAGIGEGQAYYGGMMEVDIPIQKSVYDPEKMKGPEFKFLRKLIESHKKGKQVLRYKRDDIAGLFKAFSSERGEIPIGEIDNRVVGLKRYKDLQDLQIGIEEVLVGKDQRKYHITARARVLSERNKLFGILGRVTSLGSPITEEGVVKAINQSYGALADSEARLTGKEIMQAYKGSFGGTMRSLILGSESGGLSKSLDFVANFMYGGYRMLGGREDQFKNNLRSREDAIAFAKKIYGDAFEGYERQITRARFIDQAQTIVRGLRESGVKYDTRSLGLVLAPMKHLEGKSKFGIEAGDLERYVLDELGVSYDKEELRKVFASGVAIGAGSMFAGSPPQILARNMAKFEPRHANILMGSLKTFFGLNSEQSVRYLNDFVLRQEGIEFSGKYLSDIQTMAMGFTTDFSKSLSGQDLGYLNKEQFDLLQRTAQTSFRGDASKMDEFRQKLIQTLDYDKPTVLEIEDYVKDQRNLDRVKKFMPTGKLIIPSGRTIEGMRNYQIARGERTENIDARLIANLKGFFEHINELDYEKNPHRRINALSTLVQDTQEAGALATRRSLSGSVLGSISMQGSGVILGEGFRNVNMSEASMQHMVKQFEKQRGYTIFMDTGGFMDSLNTFMGASTKTDIIPGATDESDRLNALTKKVGKFKSFMFGHLDDSLEAVRGVALRNPGLGITHMLPGIALGRMDVDKRFEVSMMLEDRDKDFMRMAIETTGIEDIQKRVNKESLAGLTARDVFDVEQALSKNQEMQQALNTRKINQNLSAFNKAIGSFFGMNVPNALKSPTLTQEGVESTLNALKSMPEYKTNQTLRDAGASLRGVRSSLMNVGKTQRKAFEGVYKNIIERFHNEYGAGGGSFVAPTFEAEIKIAGREKAMRSRFDLMYSMIGDFDADTYQFFHETKNIMNEAMKTRGDEMISKISGASARFGIVRNMINEAFNEMGRKIGSGDMAFRKLIADEARKEVILKNVGSLDVQFKSALLGMVENSLRASDADQRGVREAAYLLEQVSDITMGAFASTNLQEMGQIKAKKLPFAAEIGAIMAGAVREGLETGETKRFEEVFTNLVLNNSKDLREGFTIESAKLLGVDAEGVQSMYRKSIEGQTFSGVKMMQAISEGIRTAHREGFGALGSESKLVKNMRAYGSQRKGLFDTQVAQRSAMELAMLGEPTKSIGTDRTALDMATEALEASTTALSRIKAGVQRGLSGKGMAGIIGASLVGSYAIGANYSTSALSGPDKFSDIKVKNEIAGRAIYNNFNRQHNDVPATSMQQPHNVYQRQILKNQMYVSKPSSIAVAGNVNSMRDGQQVLQTVRSMGGQGHMSIQDNVLPRPNMADYYMRE